MLILRRTHKWLLAGALLALVLPARAAEVDKYLPEDFDFIAVLNVKQILESPLVKKHGLEKAKEFLKEKEEVGQVLTALGFDPFKDLSSVTIVGMDIMPPNNKGYVILHGQFDIAKFESKAEEVAKDHPELKIHKEGDHKIYEVSPPNADKPLFVGLMDKTTIIASTEKDFVLDSFGRASGKTKGTVKKELQELVEKADAKQSVWMGLGHSIFDKIPQAGQDEKAKKSIEKIKDLTFGLSIAKDIKLTISVTAKSADSAKELAEEAKEGLETAKGFLALAAGQEKRLAPLVDLVGGMKISTEGSTVTLKGEASEELIEKSLPKE
jgi:hypothetical protein